MIDPTHPEGRCQQCGGANIIWHADSDLWNRVNGSPNGILCPICFAEKAAATTGVRSWKLIPDPAIDEGVT